MQTEFDPKDKLEDNFSMLRGHLGLPSEGHVSSLISSFTIEVKGVATTTTVGDGKYKSALLMVYLAQMDRIREDDGFTLDREDRKDIKAYFGETLVADALSNPNTKHTTIRDLLANGRVKVTINRPKVA